MSLILNLIPGFADLPDDVLEADDPAFGLHVGQISSNAAFGMVRCEVFAKLYKHGETVDLPISASDGYVYTREELTYLWSVANTVDPSTGWISGPDCLWFMNWNVDQATGEVFSEEWYERSSTADSRAPAKSNDGTLVVFTIAQRQKSTMYMAAEASYASIDETAIATDKPYSQDLAQHLNQNAKFSGVNTEVFYLGEYVDGQTVRLPISPVDGYAYSLSECKFLHCWRWTTSGAAYVQPGFTIAWFMPGLDQAGNFTGSIDSSGHVSLWVNFSNDGGEGMMNAPGFGRIAAFAFCTRSATPGSAPLANNFTELDPAFFFPGNQLRASSLLTVKRNIDEAVLNPEFFGPTDYADGQTIPLPVSARDGYTYSRSELQYIWSWSVVENIPGGHGRLPLFLGSISAAGVVQLHCWRLRPGGPYDDDNNTYGRARVIVVASRQAAHPELSYVDVSPPSDGGGSVDGAGVVTEIALAPLVPGSFTMPQSFGAGFVAMIQMTSGGEMWFRTPVRYDAVSLYLVASDGGITGFAELLPLPVTVELDLTPSDSGDFSVAHGLGTTPELVLIQPLSAGAIWAKTPIADATNLYFSAAGAAIGKALVYLTAPSFGGTTHTTLDLTPGAAGNFTVAHSLGATPKLVLIRPTSGGKIWFQTTRYDGTNLYLVASDAGVTGVAEIWA